MKSLWGRVLGAAAAALLLASGAQAAPKMAGFTVDGQAMRMQIPDGLCEPYGDYIEISRQVAALDRSNVTVLTLLSCADMAAGRVATTYLLVKAPNVGAGQMLTRKDLLSALGEIPPSDLASLVDKGANDPELIDRLSRDGKIDVVKIGIKPVGIDESGMYLAGALSASSQEGPFTVSYGGAMSVVRGKVVSLNFYGGDGSVETIAEQLAKAKSGIRLLIATNEGS